MGEYLPKARSTSGQHSCCFFLPYSMLALPSLNSVGLHGAFWHVNIMVVLLIQEAIKDCIIFCIGSEAIGVCYGMKASKDQFPSPDEVVRLYKRNNIWKMRTYSPDEDDVLKALEKSDIELMLGVPNGKLKDLAKHQSKASKWVEDYIVRYKDSVKFKYIAVGNEVSHTHPNDFKYILPAMRNIYSAVQAAGFHDHQIKVSTAVYSGDFVEGSTYPPCNSVFRNHQEMKKIVAFLVEKGAPLLANVYPFFAYLYSKGKIESDYALFKCKSKNEHGYQNLFDAMVDTFYYALEKLGGGLFGSSCIRNWLAR